MKFTLMLLFCLPVSFALQAQENQEPPPGAVSAKIYTHFNWSLDPDNRTSAFGGKRAYFG